MILAVTATTLGRSIEDVVAGILPFIATNIVVLGLVSYIPALSTFLPRLLGL